MGLILLGLLIGFLASLLTKKTDLGRLGNIMCCILGALTGYFAADSLGILESLGNIGIFLVASLCAVFYLYLMRILIKAF